jgi:UDP-N-acetylmuramate--alanine ligase
LTNVDIDHLDHFADFDAIVASFTQYLVKVPGPSVVCLDDAGCRQVLSDPRLANRASLITYGMDSSAHVRYSDITVEKGTTEFTVHLRPVSQTERLVRVKTTLRGVHNVANITAVIAMADALGIPGIDAASAVSEFTGVGRRFQIAGQINDLTFVDDYAHLPREIDAVLQAARNSDEGWNRIVAVFQPNRFNRMAKISASYADCFQNADVVVVTDIYGSGTTPIPGVTGHLVVEAIESAHPEIDLHWAPERDSLADVVSRILKPGDMCISMGCGDIETLPFELLDIFREAHGID